MKWPIKNLLPVFDLFRVFLTHHGAEHLFAGLDSGVNYITIVCQVLKSESNDVFITMCLKVLTNIFKNNNSRYAGLKFIDIILDSITNPKLYQNPKLNLRTAFSTLLLNISISAEPGRVSDVSVTKVIELISQALYDEKDGDISLRYEISIGNLLLKFGKNIRDFCIKISLPTTLKNLKVPIDDSNYNNLSDCTKDLINSI